MVSRASRSAVAGILAALLAATPGFAQFIPYFGKNKVKYDAFAWRIYKSPHFEVYYYPEFEQHLARLVSYAESGYQKISADLKHELNFLVPLILYKTQSEFQQTNLYPGFIPEGALAFSEPTRNRMVVPIDEPPDRLQGLVTHELTHVFEFDLIPRNVLQHGIPLWVDEGLAEYERGLWDTLDLMTIRDAAVTEQIPRLSRSEGYIGVNPRVVYNMGHAAFEYIEARFGKEGIRQFLYTLRKGIVGGTAEDIYQQAFRLKPDEFDQAFEKWLKERFKPFRDKQRPSDYGRDLSPDPEKGSFTQVIGFAPSPSGELVAAITGNRADGELDLVLLSARDREVIKNLTAGYSGRYEDIAANFTARSIGRSIGFDPQGDQIAFFARTGKRRSLFLVSVTTGQIMKRVPIALDEPSSPCLLPDGRRALFTALKEGVADVYLLDLTTGEHRNLTDDAFADSDPQISPDGSLVVYSRRVSGYDKLYIFPLADPSRKTQLTFGTFDDVTPIFSKDGQVIQYASNADDDIFNIRSLDLRTGVIQQHTDALGGNMSPAAINGREGERVAFISYFKGEYRLHTLNPADPLKEVDQEIQAVTAAAEPVDFQPDLEHQVVPENKRRKRIFEKLYLEGRPPLNVAVTSGGDFYGGTQLTLSDVLGDQNFQLTFLSYAGLRTYEGLYFNLEHRIAWGINVFDRKYFFYADPYGFQQGYYDRSGAYATQRTSGAMLAASYPLDRFRRLDFEFGVIRLNEQFGDSEIAAAIQQQYQQAGIDAILNDGTLVPLRLSFVQETTRFREFGPLSGSTFALGFEAAPGLSGGLSRYTLDGDVRGYWRLGSTSVLLAGRLRGFYSFGKTPAIGFFGGNMELRGFPYMSFSGNQGFHANLELRLPVIEVMKTPIGLIGPVRGVLFSGIGGAHYNDQPFKFATSGSGYSYLNDATFGEPVSGFHLVDGRASYGVGLQAFLFGYPIHFDWSKFTDFKVTANSWRFDWWIGFDF